MSAYDRKLVERALEPRRLRKAAKDPGWAYLCAKDVLRGRWYPVEKFIAENLSYAHAYATNVCHGRFLAYERVLFRSDECLTFANTYLQDLYVEMLRRIDPAGHSEFLMEHGDWKPQ